MVRGFEMIYVLLERRGNVMSSMEPEFLKRFNKSSIVRLGTVNDSDSAYERFKTPPIFDPGWLIICQMTTARTLRRLNPEVNSILIEVDTKANFTRLTESLSGFEYKVIDNYKVDVKVVIEWIMDKLHVDRDHATYLYKKANGNLSTISDTARTLSMLDTVTKTTIRNTIQCKSNVGVSAVVEYVLGVAERVSYDDILQFVYDFRYAMGWLRNSMVKELKLYEELFNLLDDGTVTLKNYRDTVARCGTRGLQSLSDYRIKKMIEAHDYVSLELVVYTIVAVQRTLITYTDVTNVINLVKAGGNLGNVYNV